MDNTKANETQNGQEKKSKWEIETTYSGDISYKEAYAAYSGISFSPEKRAENILKEWPGEMVDIYGRLKAVAIAGNTESMLDAEFERFHLKYLDLYRGYLHSQSNCFSTMIAGPSNFPAASQMKKGDRAQAKLTEMLDFKKRVIGIIGRKLRPDLAPIRTEDSDAVIRLKEKIESAEKHHKVMKEYAAYCRKITDQKARFEKLVSNKLLPTDSLIITEILGIESWALTNSAANIRSMKKRLEEVIRKQAAPEVKETGKDGIRFEACPGENRVRLFYSGKPAPEVIKDLKSSGFRWTPSLMCWQAYHNYISIMRARRFAGLDEKEGIKI
jgi:hypothetical protein